MDRRNLLQAGGVMTAGACLSSTALLGSRGAWAQGAALPVRFTCGANLTYTNLYVAEGAGLFKKHGIDGRVVLFDVAFQGTEAVLAGQAETAATVEFPLVNYLSRGADLIVPAVIVEAHDVHIVTLKSVTKPEDLVGKKVGLIVGSIAHYGFDRYVQHHKLPKDKVQVINVPAAEQVALFAKGDIDAYVWIEPVVSRGIEVMKGRAHVLAPGLETVMKDRIYLQVTRSWAEKNPAGVPSILRALIEANEFIKANPEKTAEIAGKKLNLPAAQVAGLIQKIGWDWGVSLDASLSAVFDDVINWMKDGKRLAGNAPDIKRVFAPSYLRAIDPSKVRGFL